MIVLYHGSGAGDFTILDPALGDEAWSKLKRNACRLLRARGCDHAVEILDTVPFQVSHGTNFFQDEFEVLHRSVPIEEYVSLEEQAREAEDRFVYRDIASALSELGHYIRFIVIVPDLDAGPEMVPSPKPTLTSASVERALRDAAILLQSAGAASAVDRVHTALHAYLLEICKLVSISVPKDPSLTLLFKLLRERHPKIRPSGPRVDDLVRVMGAIATILDAMNPVRNRASGAHPTEGVLGEAEAILVINCGRTVLHYLDARLKN